MWELDRALEDDERASTAFLGLGGAGIVTWFGTLAFADSLLPVTTIATLGTLVFGVVGWRAAKQGIPREATTFVAVVLAVVIAVLWLFLLGSLALRLT
ncbi:MAG: hypothetical protein ABI649_02935 [Gaiellaceae bacterium]